LASSLSVFTLAEAIALVSIGFEIVTLPACPASRSTIAQATGARLEHDVVLVGERLGEGAKVFRVDPADAPELTTILLQGYLAERLVDVERQSTHAAPFPSLTNWGGSGNTTPADSHS